MASLQHDSGAPSSDIESAYAWWRLAASTTLCAIGSVGMWSFLVILTTVQAEFGADRAAASLPFSLTMAGFAIGSLLMGRLIDRAGSVVTVIVGTLLIATGYVASAFSPNLTIFALTLGVIGFGSSATFGPLLSDVSHWFGRRRGIAVAVCASGNMLAGAVWPPLVQALAASNGWRATHIAIAAFCLVTMLPLTLMLRRRAHAVHFTAVGQSAARAQASLGVPSRTLMALLVVAGFACCTAMAMPQAHIVAYCGDLGFGPARGAQMLSLMMAMGIVSRIASGFVADRLGGLPTLLICGMAQALALALYSAFDGMASLFVISALFGLFQGGLVPMYAIIVREYFPPREAGSRVGILLMATLIGMAFGGWASGLIFDLTGSYRLAFVHGLAWNLLNVAVVLWLVAGPRSRARIAPA